MGDVRRIEKVIFDVFVADPVHVDFDIFKLWLQGIDAHDAAKKVASTVNPPMDAPLAKAHVTHQYRLFGLLEEKLHKPASLSTQLLIQVSSDVQQALIEQYYTFDDAFARELAGRKLTNKLRRDMSEICDRINLPLDSALRQYDNMRNVYKCATTETSGDTAATAEITNSFLISNFLATKYKNIVFLAMYKPNLVHRRLLFLSYPDIELLASTLISHWTDGKSLNIVLNFKDIRDLKALLTRDIHEMYRRSMLQILVPKFDDEKLRSLDPKVRDIIKAILKCGADISDLKELKDLFVDMVEKVCDHCSAAQLSPEDMNTFFITLAEQCAIMLGIVIEF